MKCKQELSRAKTDLLKIDVMSVVSNDLNSLLPDEVIRYYESQGIAYAFLPLLLMGKAKSFSHLCPDLSSDNPEDLGAYSHSQKDFPK